jgi:hypothetical protein
VASGKEPEPPNKMKPATPVVVGGRVRGKKKDQGQVPFSILFKKMVFKLPSPKNAQNRGKVGFGLGLLADFFS